MYIINNLICDVILARMLRRKCRALVIDRLSSSYKNFNVVHHSKGVKGINIKLGIFAQHGKVQFKTRGITGNYSFGVMPPFTAWCALVL